MTRVDVDAGPRQRRVRSEWTRGRNLIGLGMAVVFVLPVGWLVITALTAPSALGKFPPPLLPQPATLGNFSAAFTQYNFGHFILNSALVGTISTVAVVVLATPAAYALARTSMRGKTSILVGLLVVAVFPEIAVVAPLYVLLREIGWLNSYQALIVPYTAFNLPFAIWVLRNTFRMVPKEMEEAGAIDGASTPGILVRIILPQVLPGLFVAGILTFVACWTEFLMALSFNSNAAFQTIPVGIALFGAQFTMPYGTIFAASFVALVPVLAIALVFRKWVVSGLSSGAVKG